MAGARTPPGGAGEQFDRTFSSAHATRVRTYDARTAWPAAPVRQQVARRWPLRRWLSQRRRDAGDVAAAIRDVSADSRRSTGGSDREWAAAASASLSIRGERL